MLTYEIQMYRMPSPKPGKVSSLPLLFQPGTIVGGLLNSADGKILLHTQTPQDIVEGQNVEFCVYFCPPDPNNHGAWLVPQSARLGNGGTVIGQTQGLTHIIIGTKAE